ETAEEQYRQQVGTGPGFILGASDRHFDPEKSETLKAIKAGEADDFGRNFNRKIVEAEAPHVPPPQEPYWAQTARSKSERARSTTPPATYTTPNTPYYAPYYSTLQQPKKHTDVPRYQSIQENHEKKLSKLVLVSSG
ncbi:unnamed protein product, partial [Gongylonema pulchrum]|uniref:LsmAD domain-containing protein n=1 Tax=Gongylonema pulchrum TaxID=637853 RepID=A0A183DAS0_9BILA